jgi:hypothetical protein
VCYLTGTDCTHLNTSLDLSRCRRLRMNHPFTFIKSRAWRFFVHWSLWMFTLDEMRMKTAFTPFTVDESSAMHIQSVKCKFALSKIWKSAAYSMQTKLRNFNINVKAVLLYGCETWKNLRSITAKRQVFINKCLRKILRIFWPDQISNMRCGNARTN